MRHNHYTFFLVYLLTLCGCAASQQTCPPPVVVATKASVTNTQSDGAIATVNGVSLDFTKLSNEAKERLRDFDNENTQRRFHLLWLGAEEAIGEELLRQEAKKRNVSVDALHQEMVEAKLVAPTDADVHRFYDENRDRIPVEFATAEPYLRKQLLEQRREEIAEAYVNQLRLASDVRLAIEAPELPRYAIETGDAPSIGATQAKVTVVEFADYQCPYCAQAKPVLEQLRKMYPNDLRLVFRDFPLSQHKDAQGASEAAFCAHEQGKFWPYHDLLFQNIRNLGSEDLRRYARDTKLNMTNFESCLKSERPKAAVAQHEKAGRDYGVQGTPAIFINGVKLIGVLPLPLLQALVERELARN